MKAIVVLSTAPDLGSAQKIARGLVENKLAACVSVLPGFSSTYRWKKKIEKAREVLLIIKTSKDRWKAAQKYVLSRHPYEVPELLVLPVVAGSKKYLDWMKDSGL